MNHRPFQDNMMFIPQLYPADAPYTQIIAQQGYDPCPNVVLGYFIDLTFNLWCLSLFFR